MDIFGSSWSHLQSFRCCLRFASFRQLRIRLHNRRQGDHRHCRPRNPMDSNRRLHPLLRPWVHARRFSSYSAQKCGTTSEEF